MEILEEAARQLAGMAQAAAAQLASRGALNVSYGGGVFKSRLVLERFRKQVGGMSALAKVVEPRFGPEVGALILSFRAAGNGPAESALSAMAASQGQSM